jgi:hypothetical protein
MPAHPHMAPAKLVLEAGVDALCGAAFVVTHVPSWLPARR